MPLPTIGPGIERLTGTFVLLRHPGPGFVSIAIFQPAVRIRDRNAVEDVDDRLPMCGGRSRNWMVTHDPYWVVYRGWPWSGASWPYASSSSLTWVPRLTVRPNESTEHRAGFSAGVNGSGITN